METYSQIQLGKNGITENFLSTLKGHFNKHKNVKIAVLKNAGHDKQAIAKYREEILEHLGDHYTAKVLGFTIFVKRWRRAVR